MNNLVQNQTTVVQSDQLISEKTTTSFLTRFSIVAIIVYYIALIIFSYNTPFAPAFFLVASAMGAFPISLIIPRIKDKFGLILISIAIAIPASYLIHTVLASVEFLKVFAFYLIPIFLFLTTLTTYIRLEKILDRRGNAKS